MIATDYELMAMSFQASGYTERCVRINSMCCFSPFPGISNISLDTRDSLRDLLRDP